ncbi:MAG: lipopolysaccharide biosynthesis protein [Promethearchaeota archaeon]
MKEKFLISVLFPMISSVLSVIASLCLYVNLAKEAMGSWQYVNSLVLLGLLFVTIGLESMHYQYSTKEDFDQYFMNYLFMKVILIVFNVTISIIIFAIIGFLNSEFAFILVNLLIWRILVQFRNILRLNLQTKFKFIKLEIIALFYTSAFNIVIIIFSFNIDKFIYPLESLSLVNLISEIFIVLLLLLFSLKNIKFVKPSKKIIYSYLKDGKSLYLVFILLTLTQNLGNVLLYQIHGGDPLAEFYLVYTITFTILASFSLTIRPIYYTLYARYFKENDIQSIKNTTHTIERYSSIVYLGIIALVILNGELVLSILMPNYTEAYPIFCIMIFVPYFLGLARPYQSLLIPGKKQTYDAIVETLVQIMTLFLIIFLLPEFGKIGYTLSLTIPTIFQFMLSMYLSTKFFKIKGQKSMLLVVLPALSAFLVMFLVKTFFSYLIEIDILMIIITSGLLIGTYLFSLYLSNKFVKIRKQKIIIIIFLTASTIFLMILISRLILLHLIQKEILVFILTSGLLLGLYLLFLYFLGLIKSDDFRLLKELLRLKNYVRSLKEEL